MASQAEKELGSEHGHAKYRVVRKLRSATVHDRELALFGAESREVIVERIGVRDAAARASLTARAKAYASVVSPHLPRVVEATSDASTVTFVTTSVEGEWLHDLRAADTKQGTHFLALAVELRILLDVIAALSAIHAFKGAGAPLMHGAIAPGHVLVGVDGLARVTGEVLPPGSPPASCVAHLAPEVLLGDGTADARADVYSVCALLWEALSGKPLFTESGAEKVIARQLAGPLPHASVREAWAEPLAEVAARGLAVDPSQRHASVTDIAMKIRLVAQARLAAPTRVGRTVESLAEDKLARRKRERAAVPAAPPSTPSPSAPKPFSATITPTPTPTQVVPKAPRPGVATHESGMRRIEVPAGMEIPTPRVPFAALAADIEMDERLDFPISSAPPPALPVAPDLFATAAASPAAIITPAPLPAPCLPIPEPSTSEVNLVHIDLPEESAAPPQRRRRAALVLLLALLGVGVWVGVFAWLKTARDAMQVATPTVSAKPSAAATAPAGSPTHAGSVVTPTPSSTSTSTSTSAAATAAAGSVGTSTPTPTPTPTKRDGSRKRKAKPSPYEPEGI